MSAEAKKIEEVVDEVLAKEREDSISATEVHYLQKVFADVEQANALLNQAAANLNHAAGAKQSFIDFLSLVYGLKDADKVDVKTGVITRAE